jgi:hypothetical protein
MGGVLETDAMTKSEKRVPTKAPKPVLPLSYANEKEIEEETAGAKREADEVEKYVDERQDSIRRGARRTKHRFRI